MENGDISSVLSGLMNDPSILAKVNEVLSDPNAMNGIRNAVSGTVKEPEPEKENRLESVKKEQNDEEARNRARLIASLKPYLSPERREKADKLMGLLTLLELSGSKSLFGKGGK